MRATLGSLDDVGGCGGLDDAGDCRGFDDAGGCGGFDDGGGAGFGEAKVGVGVQLGWSGGACQWTRSPLLHQLYTAAWRGPKWMLGW